MKRIGTTDGRFVDGTRRVPGTPVTAGFLNAVQEEIANAIEHFGENLDPENNKQLYEVLKKQFLGTTASVDSITDLRQRSAENGKIVNVRGYYGDTPGIGGGLFVANMTDKTSTDNGGTVIIGTDGTRWQRMSEQPILADFGGRNDESTPVNEAIARMTTAVGYIKIGKGVHKLDTSTIAVPLKFLDGGALTCNVGQTITIQREISTTPDDQYIFRGDGEYVLSHNTTGGENLRQIRVSWFGARTHPYDTVDQAPAIAKAIRAMGNSRESEIIFELGNYYVASTIPVYRGAKIKGAGMRRTVFRVGAESGVDIFVTQNVACFFEDIQFEVRGAGITRSTGYFVKINHGECEITNVAAGWCGYSIGVFGGNCRINNVMGTYSTDMQGDIASSLIDIQASNCSVNNVSLGTSPSAGPTQIVRIGGVATANISGTSLTNIFSITGGALVGVYATTCNVSRSNMRDLRPNKYYAVGGDAISLKAGGSYVIQSLNLTDIVASPSYAVGINIIANDNAVISDINIDNAIIQGTTGVGIQAVRATGATVSLMLGGGFSADMRTQPLNLQSGVITKKVNFVTNIAP